MAEPAEEGGARRLPVASVHDLMTTIEPLAEEIVKFESQRKRRICQNFVAACIKRRACTPKELVRGDDWKRVRLSRSSRCALDPSLARLPSRRSL